MHTSQVCERTQTDLRKLEESSHLHVIVRVNRGQTPSTRTSLQVTKRKTLRHLCCKQYSDIILLLNCPECLLDSLQHAPFHFRSPSHVLYSHSMTSKEELLRGITATNYEKCNFPQLLDAVEITVSTMPNINLYLFELVQNSLDCGASEVKFSLGHTSGTQFNLCYHLLKFPSNTMDTLLVILTGMFVGCPTSFNQLRPWGPLDLWALALKRSTRGSPELTFLIVVAGNSTLMLGLYALSPKSYKQRKRD